MRTDRARQPDLHLHGPGWPNSRPSPSGHGGRNGFWLLPRCSFKGKRVTLPNSGAFQFYENFIFARSFHRNRILNTDVPVGTGVLDHGCFLRHWDLRHVAQIYSQARRTGISAVVSTTSFRYSFILIFIRLLLTAKCLSVGCTELSVVPHGIVGHSQTRPLTHWRRTHFLLTQ